MGNPHAVFWATTSEAYDHAGIGSMLENHPLFPEPANVSLRPGDGRDPDPAEGLGAGRRPDPTPAARRLRSPGGRGPPHTDRPPVNVRLTGATC